jgi:hypothetical protein
MQSTRKVQARLVSLCLCRCGCVEDAVQQIVKKPSCINKHISDMFWHFLTFSDIFHISWDLTSPGEKAKSQVAIRFKDAKGVELYDLTLRKLMCMDVS